MAVTISIIIVHYKTPLLLKACIASLEAAARGLRAELVIVNNSQEEIHGSTHLSTKIISNARNVGYSAAANAGSRIARGEFLLFLNPDTVVGEGALVALLHSGRIISALGCAGPRMITPRGIATSAFPFLRARDVRWWPLMQRIRSQAPSLRINQYQSLCQTAVEWTAINGNLSGAALLVPRWVAEKIGPRDDGLTHFGEEHVWQAKMAEFGLKRVFVPQAIVFHWEGAAAVTDPAGAKRQQQLSRLVFLQNYLNLPAGRRGV